MSQDEGTYDFLATVKRMKTDHVLLRLGEREVWMPRAACTFKPEKFVVGDQVDVAIPIWLVAWNELEDEAE